MMNKKAQQNVAVTGVSLLLLVFVLMIVMVMMFFFLPPVNSVILSKLAEGQELILKNTGEQLDQINDANVKGAIDDALNSGIDAGLNNFEVNTQLYRFGWVFFVIILFVVIFLLTKGESFFSEFGMI